MNHEKKEPAHFTKPNQAQSKSLSLSEPKPIIAIVGLGVMGGSFAARLKELGYRILGIDNNKETLAVAKEKGWIEKGESDPAKILPQADVILLCLYPSMLEDWLKDYQKFIKPQARLYEIGGVKEAISEKLQKELREDLDLVSIHPMCGRESQGIAYASPRIFDGANFIIIPHEQNQKESLDFIEALASDLGCKNINALSAKEHDRMIAFLSQLTHVIAVSLMNTHENSHLVDFSGDSFRELTRIAKINETMWSELFLLNKEVLLEEINAFEKSLDLFKQALKKEDVEQMEAYFIQSRERRELFD